MMAGSDNNTRNNNVISSDNNAKRNNIIIGNNIVKRNNNVIRFNNIIESDKKTNMVGHSEGQDDNIYKVIIRGFLKSDVKDDNSLTPLHVAWALLHK